MAFGVLIEEGPKDWQIIQQKNGYADIILAGSWKLKDGFSGNASVYVRIVREDSGDSIIGWIESNYMDECKWNTVIKDVPTGGLYRLETCLAFSGSNWSLEWGMRGDIIHHMGVGDLYVIAGQSNSVGYGKDPAYDPPELGVHIYRNSGIWDLASHPLNDSTGSSGSINTDLVNPGNSPYLRFAKELKRVLGYPVGLVQTALGGSALSEWSPNEGHGLYRNMLYRIGLCGGKVKGILWYQGCSDADNGFHEEYMECFQSFVFNLRKDLSDQELPIITIQLNRNVGPGSEMRNKSWGTVREAQRQAARQIGSVFIVPTSDCTLSDNIHNSSAANVMLGERIAKTVLGEIYLKKYISRAPDITKAVQNGENSICLMFDNIYGRLSAFDISVDELPFTVADENGKAVILKYKVNERNSIILELDRKLEGPTFVHGAYEQNPKCFLPYDTDGHLPMLAFYNVPVERREN